MTGCDCIGTYKCRYHRRSALLGCVPACKPPVHFLPCPTAEAIQEAEWGSR